MTIEVEQQEWGSGTHRTLFSDEAWSSSMTSMFLTNICTALHWEPSEEQKTCDELTEISSQLRMLTVLSAKKLDDSALGQLVELRQLDAMTRGKNPLDLTGLVGLTSLAVDDREHLTGLDLPHVTHLRLAFTRRALSDFEQCPSLKILTLEAPRNHVVELAARPKNLEDLGILSGRLESLVGLKAPKLRNLTVQIARSTTTLDLTPLLELPDMATVAIKGPRAVTGLADLRARGIRVSFRGETP